MQELEDKIEAVTDELRQERRRVKTATIERERVDKMAAKLKKSTHELEGRLEMEARRSGKEAAYIKVERHDVGHVETRNDQTMTAACRCDVDVHA